MNVEDILGKLVGFPVLGGESNLDIIHWIKNYIETFGIETTLVPNKEIIQQIDFGTGTTPEVYWEINSTDNGNEVTWGMRGESSFSEKAYWLTQGGIEKNMLPMYKRGLELLEQHIFYGIHHRLNHYRQGLFLF